MVTRPPDPPGRPDPPETSHRGIAASSAAELGPPVLRAWDDFLALAAQVDLEAPTRLPGWRAREVLVHLGTWEDNHPLAHLVGTARAGTAASDPSSGADDANARVTRAHVSAGRAEVLGALQRARAGVAAYFSDGTHDELGLRPSASVLGPLPLGAVVHAGCYELAVHGLDLRPGLTTAHMLGRGLAALSDVTGALASARALRADVALLSPEASWRLRVDAEGWSVDPVDGATHAGTAVRGSAATILEASSGRGNVVGQLLSRAITVQGAPGLLALAPIVDTVPGLPGGPALRLAARHLGSAGRLVGRLPFGRRGGST